LTTVNPEAVVQRQLDAYNARDLEGLMATYAPDARHYEYPDTLLAAGGEALRERFSLRFREPNLHARLLHRTVMGHLVIDHEVITRTFPEGPGTLEMLCFYEVREGRIAAARFLSGAKLLTA
jgi:hypothetical protein